MATRASSKKEPSQKAKPKADPPAEKIATPQQPATDLISPTRKKPQTEARTSPEIGCSADQQSETAGCPCSRLQRRWPSRSPEAPPAKPEVVSLIGDTRSKRSESSGTEPKIKSVLPPISKIKPPILAKPPEPVVQPVQPVIPEVVPVAGGGKLCAGDRREDCSHQTSDHRS